MTLFNKTLPETEQRNKRSVSFHKLSSFKLLSIINEEDHIVPRAVKAVLPVLNKSVKLILSHISIGGRIYYVGAGTSGRVGILDASECSPTFGVAPELFQGKIAGEYLALLHSQENAEDRTREIDRAVLNAGITKMDLIIAITASGLTPYVLAFAESAKKIGCKTILISSNPISKKIRFFDMIIHVPTGREMITGSTRLKAGTSQKLILNLLSTVSLIRSGKIYENLMVDLKPISKKLISRRKRNQIYLSRILT